MSKKVNPTLVGAFVLGAILLSIAGILILGGGTLMEERFEGIMYFDESISGLDVGAPVDFQGVRIGTVTSVRIEMDESVRGTVYRPVMFQIEFNRIHFKGGRRNRGHEVREAMEAFVQQQGLRARLASQSMLTGKLKVELGYFPGTPVSRKSRDMETWEMPTILSPLAATKTEIQELPLADIIEESYRAVKNLADLLDPSKTGNTLVNLNNTLVSLDEVLNQVRGSIEPLGAEGVEAIRDLRAMLQEVRGIVGKVEESVQPVLASVTGTSQRVGNLLDPESPMRGEINLLVAEARETSRAVRLLLEFLEQHPEALLRGKP